MKHYNIIALAFIALFFSCTKDNYEEPASELSGKLVYQGQPIGVETFQVLYELYQFGFGKVGPIGSSFAQDGSYSTLLFDGDYKLIVPSGQGPFLWKKTPTGTPDSIAITLKGSQVLDLEVTPYYMINAAQIAASGNNVNATFSIEKIITDVNAKNIQNITLYINKTQFVSGGNNIAFTEIAGSSITDPNNIALSVTIPTITPTQNYVFARIGLKLFDVEDRIFSPLVQVQF